MCIDMVRSIRFASLSRCYARREPCTLRRLLAQGSGIIFHSPSRRRFRGSSSCLCRFSSWYRGVSRRHGLPWATRAPPLRCRGAWIILFLLLLLRCLLRRSLKLLDLILKGLLPDNLRTSRRWCSGFFFGHMFTHTSGFSTCPCMHYVTLFSSPAASIILLARDASRDFMPALHSCQPSLVRCRGRSIQLRCMKLLEETRCSFRRDLARRRTGTADPLIAQWIERCLPLAGRACILLLETWMQSQPHRFRFSPYFLR